jgi:hypothetical protein
MSVIGMSRLLPLIMAAGGVEAIDAQDHRRAHEALVALGASSDPAAARVLARYGVVTHSVADPMVGRRVQGVTRGLWAAVAGGDLLAVEEGHNAEFVMSRSARDRLRRDLMRTPAAEALVIHRAGSDWARRSISRKKAATPAESPAGKRRVTLA